MPPFIRQIACTLFCLWFSASAEAQIYSVSQNRKTRAALPVAQAASGLFELSAGTFARSLRFVDPQKKSVSDGEAGFSARLLYYPANWLAVGGEYSYARALPAGAFLKKQEDERWGAFGKWILSPDTVPQFYLFATGGTASFKTNAVLRKTYSARGFFVYAGIGLSWTLGPAWRAEAEYALGYTDIKRINSLVRKDSPADQSLQLRLAWRP